MNAIGPRRVLVVEPDAVTRELLSNVLRLAGFEAVPAQTGEEALSRVRVGRGTFGGLFTSVDLPGLVDGWILADEFRATQPGQPVVVAAEEEGPARADADAIVPKHVAPMAVLAQLKDLLNRCQVEMSGAGWVEPPRAVA